MKKILLLFLTLFIFANVSASPPGGEDTNKHESIFNVVSNLEAVITQDVFNVSITPQYTETSIYRIEDPTGIIFNQYLDLDSNVFRNLSLFYIKKTKTLHKLNLLYGSSGGLAG